MLEELLKGISFFDVISFDIFDTLLLRPLLDPQDVWRIVEQEAMAPGFAKSRKRADAMTYAAATRRGGETTIDEAYSLIQKWKSLRERELDCEAKILVANPEMVALWNAAGELGKKRVLVSDMYLPADFIKAQLRRCGIDGWNGFFLSSERGCRKTTGALFKVMLDEMGVSPEKVLHVGDNWQSDVTVPERLGIATIGYVGIHDRFLAEYPFVADFLQDSSEINRCRIAGALMLGMHLHRCQHPDASYWERLGFLFAGTLGHLYIRWVVDTAESLKIDHLLFVGRDGYVWQDICRKIAPWIRTDYIYAPRTASIAVLGATGNDPSAVRDRARYMEENPEGKTSEEARYEYADYLKRFAIQPGKTALVDGCSSGFSAQRLVTTSLGEDIFTFYLCAMAPLDNGAALYASHLRSLPFQQFSEFLFSSPEPPVAGIRNGNAVFYEHPSPFERFKMNCSQAICNGAIACAEALNPLGVRMTPGEFMDFFDAFARHLTVEDRLQLAQARNSTDVAHRRYQSIVPQPLPRQRIVLSLFGRTFFSVRREWKNGEWYSRTLLLLKRWPLLRKKSKFFFVQTVVKRHKDQSAKEE